MGQHFSGSGRPQEQEDAEIVQETEENEKEMDRSPDGTLETIGNSADADVFNKLADADLDQLREECARLEKLLNEDVDNSAEQRTSLSQDESLTRNVSEAESGENGDSTLRRRRIGQDGINGAGAPTVAEADRRTQ